MSFRSKRYKQESQQAGKEPLSLVEAVEKIKSLKSVKFDQTIECVLHLGIDPKQADQLVRGSISLPHGIGKQKKVVAFCEDADVEAAKKQNFETEKLIDNIEAFISHIKKIKPATAKGTYIKKTCISATMSPSITVSV